MQEDLKDLGHVYSALLDHSSHFVRNEKYVCGPKPCDTAETVVITIFDLRNLNAIVEKADILTKYGVIVFTSPLKYSYEDEEQQEGSVTLYEKITPSPTITVLLFCLFF